jgi:hypothetical protein
MGIEELLLFADAAFWNSINERHEQRGGVYKIIAVSGGKRVPVNRFLGTDNEGVLYIGKATSFLDRVLDLKKSLSPSYNSNAHICGRRYKSLPNIAKHFPFETLHVDLIPSDTPEVLEAQLLDSYRNIYGEVPPLNAI